MRRLGRFTGLLVLLAGTQTGLGAWPIAPGASLIELYSVSGFYEGPSWDPVSGFLYFTDLTNVSRILRLDAPHAATVWMNNTQGLNGTFLGLGGRLLAAQGGTRRILSMRIGAVGPEDIRILASNASWNAPNDLCQTYRGDIYFTTPDFSTGTTSAVYRIAPFGAVTKVIADMMLPNGVLASNDGQTLYVSDSWQKHWRSYPILPDGSLGSGGLFFNPATPNQNDPDGMTIDEAGNLYLTGRGGVWIVSPLGQQIEMVPVPETVANVTFGGIDGRTLYLTCNGKVYSLAMQVRGGFWTHYPDPNHPPDVSAGPDRAVYAHHVVQLEGSLTDDGLPAVPPQLMSQWTVATAGNVYELTDPGSPTTTAVFRTGTFVLRLTAYDGSQTVSDDVTLSVYRLGDLDRDGTIDPGDVSAMIGCMGGADIPPASSGCAAGDLDQDGDVDQSDFAIVQRCLGIPDPLVGTDCVN